MSRISPTLLSSASSRALQQGQPGSNGYWRRDVFQRPGTYTWTAKKTGKVKVQGLGAGGGGNQGIPGPSGAWGEKEFSVVAGEVYTIVVGAGGIGAGGSTSAPAGAAATTTSISGPGLASALVLTGATSASANSASPVVRGTAGTASGPWDKSFPGAVSAGSFCGSPSSASPFGPGITNSSAARGGAGWGGPANGDTGASTHSPGVQQSNGGIIAQGLSTRAQSTLIGGGTAQVAIVSPSDPSMRQIWDLADADSAGGSVQTSTNSAYLVGNAGPGAGGAYSPNNSGSSGSVLGGGTAAFEMNSGNATSRFKSGFGAGGACYSNDGSASLRGGDGGDALIYLFWDEVA